MKHKIIPIMAAVVWGLCFFALPAQAQYGGGNGTENDPYLIYTAEQMNAIGADANDWDKHFKLMWDIDLSGYTGPDSPPTPPPPPPPDPPPDPPPPPPPPPPPMEDIGLSGHSGTAFNIIGNRDNPFTGVFDGNGHVISNFSYTSTTRKYIGVFGYVKGKNAKIKDLGLIDPNVYGGRYGVGSLVGYLGDGTITNCYVEGGSVEGYRYVGGLAGHNGSYDGVCTITNCSSTSSVTGYGEVGGLVGGNSGTITNCYSSGSVLGTGWGIGGLLGFNGGTTGCYASNIISGDQGVGGLMEVNGEGIITNCYSTSGVSGGHYVGGLVGYNDAVIYNCYSIGSVLGTADIGGLVGHEHGQGTGCFWDIETSGRLYSAGGTGLTTAEMKITSTFLGWWCGPVWTIDEGVDYPRLVWENTPGELITAPSDLYGGGSGEPNDPYLIYTAEQLNTIGSVVCDWDKHFKLMDNIDLSDYIGADFNIIGIGYHVCTGSEFYVIFGIPFTGTFDGNGHTISNFSYTSTNTECIGLFGYVGEENAVIKDLGLIDSNVDAGTGDNVGSLVGLLNGGAITNCCVEGGSITGYRGLGGLIGSTGSTTQISNCHFTGNILGQYDIGGLIGNNWGIVSKCHSAVSVIGNAHIGGLVGNNYGTISDCNSDGDILGVNGLGGLVGKNKGKINDCFSTASVMGGSDGGLIGSNYGTVFNCYATGSVSGDRYVGGLVGYTVAGIITNCYSIGSVSGTTDVGGLVGYNYNGGGEVNNSFWDIETSGQITSDGGTGLSTAEMQMQATFTDADWDFNTPVWTIDEGVDYPRLWWEFVPVLHAEAEVTLGTSNTISWEPVVGDVEYYAECVEDANFTSIVHNSGWITETSYEFVGLELGQRYWYSVKARNSAGIESQWSNVESSLQCTLADAVDIMLETNNLKSENLKKPYIHKINIAQDMIDRGIYAGALSKLRNDILLKTDGCVESGEPDRSDWVITCEEQEQIYPLVIETIERVKSLME